jgi:hypothetical protein
MGRTQDIPEQPAHVVYAATSVIPLDGGVGPHLKQLIIFVSRVVYSSYQ